MNIRATVISLLGLLLVGCGGQASITMDKVNDADVKKAKNAIFANGAVQLDLDGDGINDHNEVVFVLAASDLDGDTLCQQVTQSVQDPNVLLFAQDDDVTAFLVELFTIQGDPNANPLQAGQLLVGDGGVNDNDLFIVSFALVKQGGEFVAEATSDGKGFLTVDTINDVFDGSVTDTLTLDVSGVNANTDTDGDGVNDAQTIVSSIKGEFSGATFCPELAAVLIQ